MRCLSMPETEQIFAYDQSPFNFDSFYMGIETHDQPERVRIYNRLSQRRNDFIIGWVNEEKILSQTESTEN